MQINKWNFQEQLALKFGDVLTADYSYGYDEVDYGFLKERVPKYWITKNGQTISNEQKEKLFALPKIGNPISSYKFVILDFSKDEL